MISRLPPRLAAETGLMVNVQNDASAAATAEKLTGKAHGLHNAICLYLGYGLGAGLILKREVFVGRHGNAGEIGMIRDFSSDTAGAVMERRVALGGFCARFGLDHADRHLFQNIERLLKEGGAEIEDWLNGAASRVDQLSEILRLTFDPDAIILCGTAPEVLIEALVWRVNQKRQSKCTRGHKQGLLVGHCDPWIVAIGAAAEPISRSFDPNYSAMLKA